MALFTLFITNSFSASHFIKLFMSFSTNVKIMKCLFVMQNNRYCLKFKKKKKKKEKRKTRKKVSWRHFISVFIFFSKVLNDINAN